MKICVIGAGSMGALYGGLLARSGQDVTLLDPWAEHVVAIQRDGLHLDGISGDLTIPVKAATRWQDAAGAELALIQVNTNTTRDAAEMAARLLAPDGYAVTLQNGIGNVETLTAVLGQPRVAGGLSYHSAALRGPGHVSHTHAGPSWLGEIGGGGSPRLEALKQAFEAAGFATTIVPDIMAQIWDKFVHNTAINPISAITGLRVGEIARCPEADALQSRILDEILAVVRAKGIKLVTADPVATIKAFCKVKFNKPSMQQHIEAGRQTEVDAMNGAVVREGRALGIPTPYNEALTWMIKGREFANRQARSQPPIDYDALEQQAKKEFGTGH